MVRLFRNRSSRILIPLTAIVAALLTSGVTTTAPASAGILASQPQPASQCFDHTPHRPNNYASCRSVNPESKVYVYNNGDTSGCTFNLTVKWDDGSTPTNVPDFPGGQTGWELLASHSYAKGGVYTIKVTGSVVSGDCTFTGGDIQFSYIPPETTYPQGPPITSAQILSRGADWVANQVPYDQGGYFSATDINGVYREDCSGFVSMAWDLDYSLTTQDLELSSVTTHISEGLKGIRPGDIILRSGVHVFLFVDWANSGHTKAQVMEETGKSSPTPYTVEKTLGVSSFKGYGVYRYKNESAAGGNPVVLPRPTTTGTRDGAPTAGPSR
jgi:hypothetical protein